jgi:hypothetical protein
MAVFVVVVAGLYGVAMALSGEKATQAIAWFLLPGAVAFFVVAIVRCLRRAVIVDDDGVTVREPWLTTFVPWLAVRGISFTADHAAIILVDGRRRILVFAPPTSGCPSLEEAYRDVRSRWSAGMGEGAISPSPHRAHLTVAFAVSALVLLFGAAVWDGARHDAGLYAARDAREMQATAVVAAVSVDADEGQSRTAYTTHVQARLRIPEGPTVLVDLERAGDWSDNFDEEDPIEIVYDAAHPHDADFADRPNRRADDDSVEARTTIGPALFWMGAAGVLVFGLALVVEWVRRVRRSRSPSLGG